MVFCAPLAAGTPRSAGHSSSLPVTPGTNKLVEAGVRLLSVGLAALLLALHALAVHLAARRLRLHKVRVKSQESSVHSPSTAVLRA